MSEKAAMKNPETVAEATAKEWAADLERVILNRRELEKREGYLKSKLAIVMKVGDRLGNIECVVKNSLDVSPELLGELEARFGPGIVRRECNVTLLREKFSEDADLEKSIPKKPSTQIQLVK